MLDWRPLFAQILRNTFGVWDWYFIYSYLKQLRQGLNDSPGGWGDYCKRYEGILLVFIRLRFPRCSFFSKIVFIHSLCLFSLLFLNCDGPVSSALSFSENFRFLECDTGRLTDSVPNVFRKSLFLHDHAAHSGVLAEVLMGSFITTFRAGTANDPMKRGPRFKHRHQTRGWFLGQ